MRSLTWCKRQLDIYAHAFELLQNAFSAAVLQKNLEQSLWFESNSDLWETSICISGSWMINPRYLQKIRFASNCLGFLNYLNLFFVKFWCFGNNFYNMYFAFKTAGSHWSVHQTALIHISSILLSCSWKHVVAMNAIVVAVCLVFARFLPHIGSIIRWGVRCALAVLFSVVLDVTDLRGRYHQVVRNGFYKF